MDVNGKQEKKRREGEEGVRNWSKRGVAGKPSLRSQRKEKWEIISVVSKAKRIEWKAKAKERTEKKERKGN